ncbi:hypothetical protein BH11PSE12_BH11PSE12_04600 [soil metagenome]
MPRHFFSALLSALFFSSSVVLADEVDTPVDSVDIKAAHERLVPYQNTYELAKKLKLASGGRVLLALHLSAAKPQVKIDDLKIWLEGDTESIPVNLQENGVFIVPVNDQIAAQKGHYVVNKKKGELMANYVLESNIAKSTWTYGLIRHTLSDVRNAVATSFP